MSLKRKQLSESHSNKKQRVFSDDEELEDESDDTISLQSSPVVCTDTEAAILYVKNTLVAKNKEDSFPPVVFVHQLSDIIKSKTVVNRQIESLRNEKKVVLIHLGSEEHMKLVILFEDLREYVLRGRGVAEKLLYQRFFDKVLMNTVDIGISKTNLLMKFRFSEKDIRSLVNAGLLILKETSTFWFSFPSAGIFMKKLIKGRQLLLNIIRKRKHHEILQTELKKHPVQKSLELPLMYHVHDLVGGNFVLCVLTSSGRLFRSVKN